MKKIVIDGGARVGELFDLLINKRKDLDESVILLYECNPNHIKTLNDIALKDKRDVRVIQKAIWNKTEVKPFYFSIDKYGDLGCTLKSEKREKLDLKNPINVECVDIDEIINLIDKDFYIILKLDVEGAEYEILTRLIQTGNIARINELYVEFHDRFFTNTKSKEIKEAILKFNVKCDFNWL